MREGKVICWLGIALLLLWTLITHGALAGLLVTGIALLGYGLVSMMLSKNRDW